MSEAANGRTILAVEASSDLDGDALSLYIRAVVEHGAPGFLAGRRWFGDKSRRIENVTVFDVAAMAAGPDFFAPTLVNVAFADGGTASYFLPLVITLEALPDDATLGIVEHHDDRWRVVEALSVPRFQEWLLARLAVPASIPMQAGTLVSEPTSVLPKYLAAAQTGVSRAITGEQSNTSIIYGDAAILKAFRKLQPGVNPDIEIGAYLTERTSFRHVPPLLGSMFYQPEASGAEALSLGVLQTFVPSTGDAWSMTLNELKLLTARSIPNPSEDEEFNVAIKWAAILGRRTGELHVALAAAENEPGFAPERVTTTDTSSWIAALQRAGVERRADLERIWQSVGDKTAIDAASQHLSPGSIDHVSAGFEELEGTFRVRVHGDYHLGQVLRTVDRDVMILDFEGEPSRPIRERRIKTSCLKDVAGMLRSFSYARVALAMSLEKDAEPAVQVLHAWEQAARSEFLSNYQSAVADAAVPLVPADASAFDRAVRAWELDKALYEIHYELNNRPDWLGHVLGTLA